VSLEAQAAKIAADALVKDWRLLEVIRDEGVSATPLHRQRQQPLQAWGRTPQVDVVVVATRNRLSRRVRDVDALVERFDTKGIALVNRHERLDVTTATGHAMIGRLAVMSSLEHEVLGERTRDAMQYLTVQGRAYGRPRVGTAPEDAATLARVHTLRAEGATLQALADTLTAAGVPTGRGGRGAPATVLGLLRRMPPQARPEVA